jgi:hypothetical protein
MKFGKLQVLKQANYINNSKRHWECKCDCGNITTFTTNQLKNLNIISCKNCVKSDSIIANMVLDLEKMIGKLNQISKKIEAANTNEKDCIKYKQFFDEKCNLAV